MECVYIAQLVADVSITHHAFSIELAQESAIV